MTQRVFWMLGVGCLALAIGCGSDSTKSDGGLTKDGGGTTPTLDGGGITLPDASADMGVNPRVDSGGVTPTSATCAEIIQCANACGADQACAQACVAKGSADAQAKFSALATCFNAQLTGACKDVCADQTSQPCQQCVTQACEAEATACLGGGGPVTAGFGDVCDPAAAQPCPAGMTCIGLQGGSEDKGFCTKKCTNQGGLCEGAPAGSMAACVLGSDQGSDLYCAFICAAQGQTYQCPSTMTCGAEQPAGSGQKPCLP